MFDNLYEEIGVKIQRWAQWIFILESIGAIIAGIVFLVNKFIFAGLFMILLGPVVALVSTWVLYAFGQLVDDIHSIRAQNPKIHNIDRMLQALAYPMIDEIKKKAKCEEEETAKNKEDIPPVKKENSFSEDHWVCGKCHTKNLNARNDCWSCGNPK